MQFKPNDMCRMKKHGVLLIAIVFVGLFTVSPGTALGQSELQSGIDAYNRRDFSEATVHLENYLRVHSNDRIAVDYLSRAYVQLGKTTQAIDVLERALRVLRGEIGFRRLLGQLYASVERYDDAERELVTYRGAHPADTAMTRLLAGVLLVQGVSVARASRWKDAEVFFDRSMGLDSTSEAVHVNLAMALVNVKEWKRAAAVAEKAIRRFPGNLQLLKTYTATLIGMGEYAKARDVLERYRKRDPDDIEVGLQLAALYRNLNTADRALELYDALIAHHPKDRRAYEELIQYWSNFFRYDKIRETYERLARENPLDLTLLKSIAGTYEMEKKWSDARSVYRRWIERDSLSAEPRFAVAATFRRDSNDTAAAAELEKLFVIAPNDEKALRMMGDILEKQDRLASARELYDRFRQMHPRNPRPYYRIGVVYKRLGLTDSARSALEQAYDLDPADPYPIAELAGIASARGDSASALKLDRRALSTLLRSMQRQQQQVVTQLQSDKDRMGLENLEKLSVAGEGFSRLRDLYSICLSSLQRGLPPKAFKAMLDEYLREYQTSIVLLLAEAEWYERQESVDKALEMYTRVLSINPGVAQALTATARLHERTGNFESAILDYRRLQSLDAASVDAYDGLVRLHSRLGRLNDLCDEWKRRYSIRPDDTMLKERLIEILHRANRIEEAKKLTH